MKKSMRINKKMTITFLSLLLTSILFAQTYIPFPTKNAFWTSAHCEYSMAGVRSGIVKVGICGDTTINTKVYHKMYLQVNFSNTSNCTSCNFMFNRSKAYYYMAFREQNKKIYAVPNGYNPSGTEYLIYDFTPHAVGDTVKAYAMEFFYVQPGNQIQSVISGLRAYPVKSITTVTMSNGSKRKKYVFDPFQIESWIEGIGSTKFMDPFFHITDIGDQLLCFSSNGVHLTTIDAGHNCDLHSYTCELTFKSWRINHEIESTDGVTESDLALTVYPNPVVLTLKLSGLPEHASITIRNSMGVEMYFKNTSETSEEIDLSYMSAGVYIIQVKDGDGNSEVKRFVKE